MDELVKSFAMTGISKSQVSRLCEQIDERVQAFFIRPIAGEWPYLWLDATYIKTRQAGRIASMAATLAVAVNAETAREILGLRIGPAEAQPFWTDFLRSLSGRGLGGVKRVIADAHPGVKCAVAKVLAFMTFPKARRTKIHRTNPLERLNAEIKRRTKVVGIFPNEAIIVRLVGALLLEQNDEWQLNRRYIQLEGCNRWRATPRHDSRRWRSEHDARLGIALPTACPPAPWAN